MAPNNDEETSKITQKCPFCHGELIIKNNLLFCPQCGVFIGNPKTFTGKSLGDAEETEREAKKEERRANRKNLMIWQVIIILLIITAAFTIYQFKLLDSVFGTDYSFVKKMQKEIPFTIYLPKKIPSGYNMEEKNIGLNYAKSGEVNSIDFIYKERNGDIINMSLFPIDTGLTKNNQTVEELFLSISEGRNLNKKSINGQDIYISDSEMFLTDNDSTLYRSIAVTVYNNLVIKIKHTGPTWMTDNELNSITSSLKPVKDL